MKKSTHNGWDISFKKNIHMYCHSLTAKKDGREIEVPCEDMAVCDGVGVWPYTLDLEKEIYSDLLEALRDWVDEQEFDYRLYTTRDDFETNATN